MGKNIKINKVSQARIQGGYTLMESELVHNLYSVRLGKCLDIIRLTYRSIDGLWSDMDSSPFYFHRSEIVEDAVSEVTMELSASDAEALIEMLLEFVSVKELHEKRSKGGE